MNPRNMFDFIPEIYSELVKEHDDTFNEHLALCYECRNQMMCLSHSDLWATLSFERRQFREAAKAWTT